MSQIFLSVVVASRNDAERLPSTLLEIDEHLSRVPYSSEILVLDDHSGDRTDHIAERMAGVVKNMKLVRNEGDRGRGAGLKKAMRLARGNYRLFTDAGHSFPVVSFDRMAPYFRRGIHVIVPKRARGIEKTGEADSIEKNIVWKCMNAIERFLRIHELVRSEHGFAMTADAAERIFSLTKEEDVGFHAEAMVIAKKLGYKIDAIPIESPPSKDQAFSRYLHSLGKSLTIHGKFAARQYQP